MHQSAITALRVSAPQIDVFPSRLRNESPVPSQCSMDSICATAHHQNGPSQVLPAHQLMSMLSPGESQRPCAPSMGVSQTETQCCLEAFPQCSVWTRSCGCITDDVQYTRTCRSRTLAGDFRVKNANSSTVEQFREKLGCGSQVSLLLRDFCT